MWMNADQVVVWREPDRYKGDRDKVPDRIYYMATIPGRRKPEENKVRRVGLQVEPQVLDGKVAGSIPEDSICLCRYSALICNPVMMLF